MINKIFLLLCVICPLTSHAELQLVNEFVGNFYVSADAVGTNQSNGLIKIEKKNNATVFKSYLMATSHGVDGNRKIQDNDVILDGNPVSWEKEAFGSVPDKPNFFHNVFADVTDVVKVAIDPQPNGTFSLVVSESDSESINGVALIVIFEADSQAEKTIVMYFGAQSTTGDSFNLSLSRPLSVDDSMIMGLGISHSSQTTSGSSQENFVDVNDTRLTSSAGGEDDGSSDVDGALITLGGVGDSTENPSPNDSSFTEGYRTDDELYDLSTIIGDKKRITVRSVNPSNDDDIFFAYFDISTKAEALPVIVPPKEKLLIGIIDPNLPTIILTHGLSKAEQDISQLWTGFGDSQAASLIVGSIGLEKANIIQYVWKDAFHVTGLPTRSEYISARNNTYNAGKNLQRLLRDRLGGGYDKPIHFIGHSLGTIVNAFAASGIETVLPEVRDIQFTALDRPDHVTSIPFITNKKEESLGFDENFFAVVLPMETPLVSLRVDNYYSYSVNGVGDKANGSSVYNHPPLVAPNDIDDKIFKGESISNNHSGVQQWYRWTMSPNGVTGTEYCDDSGVFDKPFFFDNSLNPCTSGWEWSLLKDKDNFPSFNGGKAITNIINLAQFPFSDIVSHGCDFETTDGVVRFICTEQSTPFISADISIPDDAKYISFDYKFTNKGDGDYAAVMLDNQVFWILEGSVSGEDQEFKSTGALQIPVTANNSRMKVALYGINDKNAEIMLENFKFISSSVSDNSAPVAKSMLFKSKFGNVITDVLAGTDSDGDTVTFYVIKEPNEGALVINQSNGEFTYTPGSNLVSVDSFEYRVHDGKLNSLVKTINIEYSNDDVMPEANNNSGGGSVSLLSLCMLSLIGFARRKA